MKNKTIRLIFWLIIIVIFTAIISGCVTIPYLIMRPMSQKVSFRQVWEAEEWELTAKHFFVKTDDNLNISVHEVEVENPKAVVICLSGIQNPSVTAYFGHAQLFAEHDIASILMDMRAHGESEGDKVCFGFKEWLDVKAVVQYIKENPIYDNVPIIVYGLSMGAATAINSIGQIPEIDALVSISAFSSWEDVFCDNMAQQTPKWFATMEKPFVSLVVFFKFGSKMSIKPKNQIAKLGNRPALLMHSRADSQIPYKSFERIMKKAPSHVETFIREGDLHFGTETFLHPKEDEEYSQKILQFIERIALTS